MFFWCDACGKTVKHHVSFSQTLPVGWAQIRLQATKKGHSYLVCGLTCLYALLNKWQDEKGGKGED